MSGSINKDLKFIVIRDDRIWKSIASDTYSFFVLTSCVFLGWWVGSSALQWIGGILAIFFIVGRGSRSLESIRYTIQQARAELDRLETEGEK